jgi:hypothetical protein
MVDLVSGVRSPFTSPGTNAAESAWSKDGKRVAYRVLSSAGQFVVRDADAPESSAIVQQTGNDAWAPGSWTPDGTGIISDVYRSPRGFDIGVVSADGKSAPKLLIDSPAQEHMPKLSPDGRWLAFLSDESGQDEVYVTAYPALGPKWPLTTNGAAAFDWNGNDGPAAVGRHRDILDELRRIAKCAERGAVRADPCELAHRHAGAALVNERRRRRS